VKKFHLGKYSPYVWKGINKWGRKAQGIIIAENDTTAENEARRLGMTIHYLKKRSFWLLTGRATSQIKILDIVFLMRQLSTLIAAGVPLVQSLEIMSVGPEKVKLRALLLTIRDDVASGQTFSEALTPYPYLFNTLICGLINAGELSGTLDKMVNEVANYLEYHEYLKSRIKKALYYPATVLSFALLICLAMLIFLVPRFEKIYASFNAKLPAFTMQVINFSHFLRDNWWIILMGFIALIYGFKKLREKSEGFRRILDTIAVRMILFGPLTQKAMIARISSTLAITLNAGIPLIDALNRVAKVATNVLFRDAIIQTRELVIQGEPIALSMRSTLMFPSMVTQMIEIGEKSGALDHMLEKVGEYYREQVNSAVEGLTTMIEPIMIVFVGALVGVFILAMYLPIFNLGLAVK
jgi:type IV pilus assembly protein PilC